MAHYTFLHMILTYSLLFCWSSPSFCLLNISQRRRNIALLATGTVNIQLVTGVMKGHCFDLKVTNPKKLGNTAVNAKHNISLDYNTCKSVISTKLKCLILGEMTSDAKLFISLKIYRSSCCLFIFTFLLICNVLYISIKKKEKWITLTPCGHGQWRRKKKKVSFTLFLHCLFVSRILQRQESV